MLSGFKGYRNIIRLCPSGSRWRGLETRILILQLRKVTWPRSPEELEAVAVSVFSLMPRLLHPLAKSRAAAAASLLKEEKMSRAIKTLAAGHKLITS